MITIHLVRKPLEGTAAANTLKYGTGGINIDATRIGEGTGEEVPLDTRPNFKNRVYGKGFGGGEWAPTKGRWPANLLFEHLDECKCLGMKTVVGSNGGASSGLNAFGQDLGWSAGLRREVAINRPVNPDGTETVEDWACVEGCPVADMGDQSGDTVSKAGGTAGWQTGGYVGGDYAPSVPRTGYVDSGSAARFFKQVKK